MQKIKVGFANIWVGRLNWLWDWMIGPKLELNKTKWALITVWKFELIRRQGSENWFVFHRLTFIWVFKESIKWLYELDLHKNIALRRLDPYFAKQLNEWTTTVD